MEGLTDPFTLQSSRLLLWNFWWYMTVTFNGTWWYMTVTFNDTWEEHGGMVHFVCNKWNKMSALCPQKKWSFVRDKGGGGKYRGNTQKKSNKHMNQWWLQKQTTSTSNAQHENRYPATCVQSSYNLYIR